MSKPTVDDLLSQGVSDPRKFVIPHKIENVSDEEATALVAANAIPEDFQTLRLPIQGLQLFQAGPNVDGINVSALFPKILKQQHSLVVLTPEQEAQMLQAAIGMVEIRFVLKKEALKEKENE